jgi:hypothetical protein
LIVHLEAEPVRNIPCCGEDGSKAGTIAQVNSRDQTIAVHVLSNTNALLLLLYHLSSFSHFSFIFHLFDESQQGVATPELTGVAKEKRQPHRTP